MSQSNFLPMVSTETFRELALSLPGTTEQPHFDRRAFAVYPVPNKFGLAGWTTVELDKAPEELVFAALEAAYNESLKSKARK